MRGDAVRIGSLFSGIGGLELGLEWAGLGHTVWQAEQDDFCRAVLQKHWPDAKRFEDVREVTSESAEPVDLICGGFPCQDVSLAGKGAGLHGERSGLWWEFHRIVRELRPRLVVVENVSALRSRGLAGVLGSLAEIGYDAQWDCIPAQAVGAPHRRDRLFVVAWRDDLHAIDCDLDEDCTCHLADSHGGGREEQRVQGQAGRSGQQGERGNLSHGRHSQGWPPRPDDLHAWGRLPPGSQPAICRVANGIPHRTHRLRALGNAVVPQVAEVIGNWIQERNRQ